MLCLLSGMLSLVQLLMIFGLEPVAPLKLAVLAGVPVGYIGLVGVMRLMCMLNTLLIPLLLLLYSFVDASSLLRMFSKVFGVGVLLSVGGMLF